MRMYDLIAKKRDGEALTAEEIHFMITEYVAGNIPDYQMSAFLMAVYLNGMTEEETVTLTLEVAHSGEMVDLSAIEGIKVDKHSTGGVGDKTTLIIAPIVAACGVKVAKMSGRGLGHTGGTVDKLEAIPGFQTVIAQDRFFEIVNTIGVSVIGQSGNLAPADKKMYALRDVTATVESIPLIAASIMSKKLAAGSDAILLDVKTGSGAFMKTVDDSIALAKEMVSIGENAGRKTAALITDMDIPLGNNIGNSLEVIEAVETLKGNGPEDLTEVSLQLAANMLYLAEKGIVNGKTKTEFFPGDTITREEAAKILVGWNGEKDEVSRKLLVDLKQLSIAYNDAPTKYICEMAEKFDKAPFECPIISAEEGYIASMDTESCGIASSMLGAGRETKESDIDFSAGIILKRKVGDFVKKGDVLATMYTSKESLFANAEKRYLSALTFAKVKPAENPLIFARITKDGVEKY
ncbi:MAG: thymidine phosphorylase [Lachnospiraceae bacterium]|nr:thymidine phosphorylase [Lachnospiraceae bacterium]